MRSRIGRFYCIMTAALLTVTFPSVAAAETYVWRAQNVGFSNASYRFLGTPLPNNLSSEDCKEIVSGSFRDVTVTLTTGASSSFHVVISGTTYTDPHDPHCVNPPLPIPALPDIDVTFPADPWPDGYYLGGPRTTDPVCGTVQPNTLHCFQVGEFLVGFFVNVSTRSGLLVFGGDASVPGGIGTVTFVKNNLPVPFSHLWYTRFDFAMPPIKGLSNAIPPTVATGLASGIGATSATLNGTANPNGTTATGWFEYGLTTSYGNTTPVQTLGSGNGGVSIGGGGISGLVCNTPYHFRARATSASGSTAGLDATFTSAACPLPPSPYDVNGDGLPDLMWRNTAPAPTSSGI